MNPKYKSILPYSQPILSDSSFHPLHIEFSEIRIDLKNRQYFLKSQSNIRMRSQKFLNSSMKADSIHRDYFAKNIRASRNSLGSYPASNICWSAGVGITSSYWHQSIPSQYIPAIVEKDTVLPNLSRRVCGKSVIVAVDCIYSIVSIPPLYLFSWEINFFVPAFFPISPSYSTHYEILHTAEEGEPWDEESGLLVPIDTMIPNVIKEDCSVFSIHSCHESIVTIDGTREESSHVPRELMGSENLRIDIQLEQLKSYEKIPLNRLREGFKILFKCFRVSYIPVHVQEFEYF